jgi:hypothetical protein
MTDSNGGLLRAILPPLVVVAVGAVLIGIAFALEQTPAYEWSLTVGAPSVLVLLGGLIWLGVMLIWYFVRSRSARHRGGAGRP